MADLDAPVLMEPRQIASGWTVLPSFLPVPGLGTLAVNSFLLTDGEPMLVDTGLAALADDYRAALERQIDLAELRWIWLSHLDADHVGNLKSILAKAPNAQVLTTFLGQGKMALAGFGVERVVLVEPGAPFQAGCRSLLPIRPPYYDAPETIGFVDAAEGVLFAADSFGALLPEPAGDLAEVEERTLRDGLTAWSSIDAPWLAIVDQAAFGRTLAALRDIEPQTLLSSHLPVAQGNIDRLVKAAYDAWCSGPTAAQDAFSLERALTAAA